MAQDYTVDCFDGEHVAQVDMANIEKNFEALRTLFSGVSTPSNPVAGMLWLDTNRHILFIRNEANDGWYSVWDMENNKPNITALSGDITGAMIASAIKDAAAATPSLRTLGTGSTQACAGNDSRLDPDVMSAGDVPIGESVGEVSSSSSGSFILAKSLTIGAVGGLRIKFTLKYGGGGAGYAGQGQIHRNGSPVGALRTEYGSSFVTYSEDISGWSIGDICQLYLRASSAGSPIGVTDNLSIYCNSARVAY